MGHEMGEDHLNFKCAVCSGSCTFSTSATNPMLRCSCGTPVPVLQTLKAISESDILHEKAKKAMAEGNLAEAQNQHSIWKCIWMRFGNRVVRAKAPKPALSTDDDY